MSDITINSIVLFGVLLVSLTVHEAAHALAAMLGGDRTAYHGGQVSLNPIPHIRREPFGMVVLPLFMLFVSGTGLCMGYASTPIDAAWAARHPRRAALMAAAGPASNFLLAALALLGLKLLVGLDLADPYRETGDHLNFISAITAHGPETASYVRAGGKILTVMLLLNVILGVFNLFPVPPLDGAGVARGLFARRIGGVYDALQRNPMFLIGGILVVWYVMWELFEPLYFFLYALV